MGFLQNAGNELHFHNRKSYSDSFKAFEVIDAESPIVIFFGTYGIYNDVRVQILI